MCVCVCVSRCDEFALAISLHEHEQTNFVFRHLSVCTFYRVDVYAHERKAE